MNNLRANTDLLRGLAKRYHDFESALKAAVGNTSDLHGPVSKPTEAFVNVDGKSQIASIPGGDASAGSAAIAAAASALGSLPGRFSDLGVTIDEAVAIIEGTKSPVSRPRSMDQILIDLDKRRGVYPKPTSPGKVPSLLEIQRKMSDSELDIFKLANWAEGPRKFAELYWQWTVAGGFDSGRPEPTYSEDHGLSTDLQNQVRSFIASHLGSISGAMRAGGYGPTDAQVLSFSPTDSFWLSTAGQIWLHALGENAIKRLRTDNPFHPFFQSVVGVSWQVDHDQRSNARDDHDRLVQLRILHPDWYNNLVKAEFILPVVGDALLIGDALGKAILFGEYKKAATEAGFVLVPYAGGYAVKKGSGALLKYLLTTEAPEILAAIMAKSEQSWMVFRAERSFRSDEEALSAISSVFSADRLAARQSEMLAKITALPAKAAFKDLKAASVWTKPGELNEQVVKDLGLTNAELEALDTYLNTPISLYMNKLLRGEELPTSGLLDNTFGKSAQDAIVPLDSALAKLNTYDGTVLRSADLTQKQIDRYVVGQTITETPYLSTTVNSNWSGIQPPAQAVDVAPRSTVFTIRTTQGRIVGNAARNTGELEVLIARGTSFRVVGKSWDPQRKQWVIGLLEMKSNVA